jgi:hypothetical protein
VILLVAALAAAAPASAGDVGLRWNASSGATGYKVHYGTSSGSPVQTVDVGSTTQTVLHGLADCTTLYFTVSAYNNAGESGVSNEVSSWTRPRFTGASPAAAKQGAQFEITLSGASFQPGASVEIDNPNVFLDSVNVSCNQVRAAATVEPTSAGVRPAQIGDFTVTIVNPDGHSVSGTGAFEVLVEPSRFDVNRSDEYTNGRIDGKDTIWLARLFGSQEGQSGYDPNYDFNGDGWVDGDELAYLGSNLGRCWDGSQWRGSACPQ